jgi:hypothetical protein
MIPMAVMGTASHTSTTIVIQILRIHSSIE